jgi:1-acyl-sn-glycerol-3-phosphate acyltransferase
MIGARQHILLEFFEKLAAAIALGTGGPFSGLAFVLLAGRRLGWRSAVKPLEAAQFLAFREIALALALLIGLLLLPVVWQIPFPAPVPTVLFLIVAAGLALLGERGATDLLPRLRPADLKGPAWRNLLGWVLFAFALTQILFSAGTGAGIAAAVGGLVGVFPAYGFALRRGEPGFVIPGCGLLLLGAALEQYWLVGLGAGLALPSAVQLTHNLKVNLALRTIGAALAAYGATLVGREWIWAAPLALFLLSLETWRFLVRLVVFTILRTLYRFRVYGLDNAMLSGAAVICSNHGSLLDGFLLGGHTQRMARFLVFDAYYKNPLTRMGLNLFRTIPISQGARREAIESLRRARQLIEEGHFAGIFPEGGITRAGFLQPFQKGFTRILSGSSIPIIPAYMNGLWNNFVSFSERRVPLVWPRSLGTVDIEYGDPMPPSTSARELWDAVKHLEANAAFRDSDRAAILPIEFLRAAHRYGSKPAIVSGTATVSYSELATNALLVARSLNRRLRKKARVGVLLPEGPDRILAFVAIVMAGHVAVDFSGLSGPEVEALALRLSVAAFVTSQAWIEELGLAKSDGMHFLGRMKERIDGQDRMWVGLHRWWSPRGAWRRACAFEMRKETAAAIALQPGAGGRAVVLSHRGLRAAAHAARRVLWMKPGTKVFCGVNFRSAGALSLGLWTPLLHGACLQLGSAVDATFAVFDQVPSSVEARHNLVLCREHAVIEASDAILPVLEAAEASGFVSLSSPAVNFANETQSGVKEGTFGRLPFGLEMQPSPEGCRVRTPARMLRYLDVDEGRHGAKPQDWVSIGMRVECGDQAFVEAATVPTTTLSSTQQTSSTPSADPHP